MINHDSVMQPSEIIVPLGEEPEIEPGTEPDFGPAHTAPKRAKLGQAYLRERQKQELTDIELQRSKVVVMDEHGRILRMSLTSEH